MYGILYIVLDLMFRWSLQMHRLSVISNLYGTLDIVPGISPNTQLWEITEYLKQKC